MSGSPPYQSSPHFGLTTTWRATIIIFMEGDKKEGEGTRQPDNLVYYTPAEELFQRLYTCVYLRELPEITPDEDREISEHEGQSRKKTGS